MPPKRTYDDDDDDSEETTETDSSSEEEQPRRVQAAAGGTASGRGIANKPHDEEFDVNDEGRKTPEGLRKPPSNVATAPRQSAGAPIGTSLRNNPNDETFDVDDDRAVATPPGGVSKTSVKQQQSAGSKVLSNNPHDQYEDVDDGEQDLISCGRRRNFDKARLGVYCARGRRIRTPYAAGGHRIQNSFLNQLFFCQ